jgi:hypothetical protein
METIRQVRGLNKNHNFNTPGVSNIIIMFVRENLLYNQVDVSIYVARFTPIHEHGGLENLISWK